jgi:hypothetical protein
LHASDRQTAMACHITAESEGNVDNYAYTYVPDMKVPLVCQPWLKAHKIAELVAMHQMGLGHLPHPQPGAKPSHAML